jgi:hypothetical protein
MADSRYKPLLLLVGGTDIGCVVIADGNVFEAA